jgi:asparagine synthase (glutamine-hydrolysing)
LEGSEYSGPREPESAAFARKQVNNVSFIGFTQYAAIGDQLFSAWTAAQCGTSDKRLVAVNNTLDGRTRDLITRKWHPLHSALYIWTKCALANGLLTGLGDRVEMAHSVEGRQPFLDHKLTEYVMSLPPSMKFRWDPSTQSFNEKWILKEVVKPFVTEELYKRKKHAFAAPVKYAVDGAVHKLFASLITEENVEKLGFLDWELCKDLVEQAIVNRDRSKFGQMILVGQLVILGKCFGINKTGPFRM